MVQTVLLLFFLTSVVYSHDIWLLPDRFTLAKDDTLTVRQLAGSELEIEVELEFMRGTTRRFELMTSEESVNLLSEFPDAKTQPVVKPVLKRKLDFDGLALLVMDHSFLYDKFSRKKFIEYLEEEGFELEKFQDQIGDKSTQVERWARTVKCLVQVGDVTEGDLHKRKVGQKLEILLLQNPYQLSLGDELEVQVLFDDKPLEDQLVTAFNGDGEQRILTARSHTNAQGIARFNLDRKEFWLIRLVYLMPCPHPKVDWESYWTSYSFELD